MPKSKITKNTGPSAIFLFGFLFFRDPHPLLRHEHARRVCAHGDAGADECDLPLHRGPSRPSARGGLPSRARFAGRHQRPRWKNPLQGRCRGARFGLHAVRAMSSLQDQIHQIGKNARAASRALDVAVSKGVIHSNQAANKKSAMAKAAGSSSSAR